MAETGFKAGPEGGDAANGTGSPSKSGKSVRERARSIAQRLAVVLPIGINGYLLYAFCYLIVWHRIRYRNESAAIAILVIFCWVNLHLVVSWIAIFAWGPGRVTDKYVSKNTDEDAPFTCNEQGFSLYCTYCQRVKPNRAHHSKFTDTCVPVMDHFCPWIGTVIGQGNLKFFIQFCFSGCAGMIVILVTLFVYQHQQVPHINGNSIAMYIVCANLLLFTGIMAISHSMYILLNQSTLESLAANEGRVAYVNFLWRGEERRVIQPQKADIKIPRPSQFTKGFSQNVRDVMGPVYTWTLPIREPIYEPQYNEAFIETMRTRIDDQAMQESATKETTPAGGSS